jgi:hypothetical protein
MNYEELKDAYELQKQELAQAHSEIDELHDVVSGLGEKIEDRRHIMLNQLSTENILKSLESLREDVNNIVEGPELSQSQRRIMQGAGARRYGLIDEISDIMDVNQQFIPPTMDIYIFKGNIRYFEWARNSAILAQQILRTLLDVQLILGDGIYRDALSYYGAVRDSARRRVPGAPDLFRRLRIFFTNMRRQHQEDPTEAQLLRDFRALEHGRKEGEIVIRNENDSVIKGNKTVLDDVHRSKAEFKETQKKEIL